MMVRINGIEIRKIESNEFQTFGLARHLDGRELLLITSSSKDEAINNLFNHLIKYVFTTSAKIMDQQTVTFGSWLLKVVEVSKSLYKILEIDEKGESFNEEIELSLLLWDAQVSQCKKYLSEFAPPLPSQLVVVSKGVLEGMPVQGVRYRQPEHMSGWIISTSIYDGNVTSMQRICVGDLLVHRPDLGQYLALVQGFRFDFENGANDIWFDKTVFSTG